MPWSSLRHVMLAVNPIILILGPTAGGKTRLAIDLARALPAPGTPGTPGSGGECIIADSMQVYRGMDIGTAKPTAQERAEVPHHLLDISEPSDDTFSVDRWLELADSAIAQIRGRGRWPIIVGGTNLYVQAFLGGMMQGPEPDLELRSRLNQLEPSELRQHLERIDSIAAQRIHPNDRKRTIRAIEVFEKTGTPLSQMQTQWENPEKPDDTWQSTLILGLEFPVEVINRRINARVKCMIDAGFVDEVRQLHAAKLLGRNAREALGYKQIIEFLDGRCSLEDAIEQIKIRTRRYAKQQRTWLRRFRTRPNSAWIQAAELAPQQLADKALAAILPLADAAHSTCE